MGTSDADVTLGTLIYDNGSNTKVHRAVIKATNQSCVVKIVTFPSLLQSLRKGSTSGEGCDVATNALRTAREISIFAECDRVHRNADLFVPLLGAWYQQDATTGTISVFIAMGAAACTWFDLVRTSQHRLLPRRTLVAWCGVLLTALSCLHRGGIIHRDVKPANIFVSPQTQLPWLGDFGLARRCLAANPTSTVSRLLTLCCGNESSVPARLEGGSDYVCTSGYRAPELLLGASRYTASIDAFAAGATIFELITGEPLVPATVRRRGPLAILKHLLVTLKDVAPPLPDRDELLNVGVSPESVDVFEETVASMSSSPTPTAEDLSASIVTMMLRSNAEASEELAQLACALLTFSPARRLSCESAIKLPLFNDVSAIWTTDVIASSFGATLDPLQGLPSVAAPYSGTEIADMLRRTVDSCGSVR